MKKASSAPARLVPLSSAKHLQAFRRNLTKAHEVGVVGLFRDEESCDFFIDAAERSAASFLNMHAHVFKPSLKKKNNVLTTVK